jgi:putative addiction module component (TIGR02574 family)
MNVDPNTLFALSAEEKLRLVELLWDNLGESETGIPLPEWADREALRRRDELLANPDTGQTHDQVWKKISERNG